MNSGSTNSLHEKLRTRIASEGPITFHDWMTAALYDEQLGYYCAGNRKRWGREGDYRTSPERSRLFSATFARFFVQLHHQLHESRRLTIVECGAGGGYFAAEVLATLHNQFPDLFAITNCIVDEVSPIARQPSNRLQKWAPKVTFSRLEELGPFDGIVFANELIDAFPVHRVTRVDGELREFYVGTNSNREFEWRIGSISDEQIRAALQRSEITLLDGQVAEVNLDMEDWLSRVAGRLKRGFLILVDYGAEANELVSSLLPQGSLRAFHRHEFVDNILAEPGEFDITTTVNWTAVRNKSEALGFRVVQFESQDRFLLRVGLLDQLASMISESIDEGQKAKFQIEAREMILPGGMSGSFQVLVLSRGC